MRVSDSMTKDFGKILEMMLGHPANCHVSFQMIQAPHTIAGVEQHVVLTFKEPIKSTDELIHEVTKIIAGSSAYQHMAERLEAALRHGPEDKAQQALKLLTDIAEFIKEK